MTPAVTAVVPAFGSETWLEDAVRAVLASTGVDVDVVVVDNGCAPGVIDRVTGLDRVRVLTPDRNTGYAGGCHRGASEATGQYLAFVNSDAIAAPDALARLTEVAAQPGVGLAMGSIRLADDPGLINTSGNPLHITGITWAGGYGEPADRHSQRRSVLIGSGCFFVMRRDVWDDVGGFAEEYFAYHEDAELSLRLWQRGMTVEYVPDAVVAHHYEFSRNAFKLYLIERNRAILVLTTYQRRSLILLAPALLLTEALMLASALAGGWGRAKIRGWWWLWRRRDWVAARRATIQSSRTVPDSVLFERFTARLAPANVAVPPGVGVFNALIGAYWRVARRWM